MFSKNSPSRHASKASKRRRIIMRLRVALLLSLSIAGSAQSSDTPSLLDESNFLETITEGHHRWFVFFFSPSCGHCNAMKPAWDELMQSLRFKALEDVVDLVLPNPLLAAVDASSNRALADKLQVHGYPTLLAFEAGGAVYEYDGDRSVNSMFEFATRKKLLLADAKLRRGYIDATTGTVQPSQLDLLLRAPADVNQVLDYAFETSRVAALLVLAFCFLAGMCAAVLFGYSPFPQPSEPQFLVCECPADVRPGDTFHVEILRQGAGRRLPLQGVLLWRSKPRQAANRVMQVQAPPGIAPGQTFFVPLVAPPVVRVGGKGTTFEPSATSTRQQPLASTSSASKSSTSTRSRSKRSKAA